MKEKINLLKAFCVYTTKGLLMYRINILSDLFTLLIIPIILNFFLWEALTTGNTLTLSFNYIMKYIVLTNSILLITRVKVEQEVSKDVKSPKLGQKLLRPINYFRSIALKQLLKNTITLTLIYLPLLSIFIILSNIDLNIQKVVLLFYYLFVGFTLNLLLSLIIGTLSFWLTEIWGISAYRNLMTGLLAGAYFPLDLMPARIRELLLWLPFPYMSYMPTKTILSSNLNAETTLNSIVISSVWLVLLYGISHSLFKTGIKKYSLYGA